MSLRIASPSPLEAKGRFAGGAALLRFLLIASVHGKLTARQGCWPEKLMGDLPPSRRRNSLEVLETHNPALDEDSGVFRRLAHGGVAEMPETSEPSDHQRNEVVQHLTEVLRVPPSPELNA